MRSFAILVMLAAIGTVQAAVPTYGSSLNMTIDPNSVTIQTRAGWCNAQSNTCNLLCGGPDQTNENSCMAGTLSYSCTCASNNSAPGLQYYYQTMPTFICETLFGQCNAQNTQSRRDQEACKTNINDLCGTIDPPKNAIGSESSSTSSDSATTPTSSATKTSGTAASATGDVKTTKSGGFAAPTTVPMGHGIAAAAAVGAMAVLL